MDDYLSGFSEDERTTILVLQDLRDAANGASNLMALSDDVRHGSPSLEHPQESTEQTVSLLARTGSESSGDRDHEQEPTWASNENSHLTDSVQEKDGPQTDGIPGPCGHSVAVCLSDNKLGRPIHQDHITLAERIWLVATGQSLDWTLFSSELQVRIFESKVLKASIEKEKETVHTIRKNMRAYMTRFRHDVRDVHVSCDTMISIMRRSDTKKVQGSRSSLATLYATLFKLNIAQPSWDPTSLGQAGIRTSEPDKRSEGSSEESSMAGNSSLHASESTMS